MFGTRLSNRDLWLFAETLAAAMGTGAPLAGAMESLARDSRTGRLRRVLRRLSVAIDEGESFACALKSCPHAFPEAFVTLVEAGERTNQLQPAIERLAEHHGGMHHAYQRLGLALLYPFVLTAILLGVLGFVLSLVPSFEVMYEEMEIELPGLTLMLLFLGRHVPGVVVVALATIAGTVLLLFLLWHVRFVRGGIERILLRVPILGQLVRYTGLRHFCQTAGMLLTAGEPTLSSLRHSAGASPSVAYSSAIQRVSNVIEQGGLVADGMQERVLFPRHFVWVVSTAERRGDLPDALCTLAQTFERAMGRHLDMVISLASPVYLVFVLAPMIGFIVIALFMPLIKLMGSMGA